MKIRLVANFVTGKQALTKEISLVPIKCQSVLFITTFEDSLKYHHFQGEVHPSPKKFNVRTAKTSRISSKTIR